MRISGILSTALLSTAILAQPALAQTTPAAGTAATQQNAGQASTWEVEYALWKAASEGGTIADYEAYIDAYPSGHFAGIAKNRIVKLTMEAEAAAPATASVPVDTGNNAPVADTASADDAEPVIEQGSTDSDDGVITYKSGEDLSEEDSGNTVMKAGIKPMESADDGDVAELTLGTPEEENALLDRTGRREMQGRLTSLGFSTRGVDGSFGRRSRAAITDWQLTNGAPASGYFSGDQIALLRKQSMETYPQWLAANAQAPARSKRRVKRVYKRGNNDAAAAAVFGLAAGAIIGSAAARRGRGYYRPRYRRYRRW
ncbi:MAG: hypothetical protein C0606_17715 [Hyphomicrobiales bacterium]|nr:MAG: hypothetical protein C0606_17715 [Hyphomicrobiales bacterium]